jgi:predicted GH43/DUF377 family glycosyl hydrolase
MLHHRNTWRFIGAILLLAVLASVALAGPPGDIDVQCCPRNPVMRPGEAGAWDDGALHAPNVVWHNGQFHMFYSGTTADGQQAAVGYAISPNGMTWTRSENNPLIVAPAGAIEPGVVLIEDDTWVMYANTVQDGVVGQTVERSTAPAPTGPWASSETVLTTGPADAWDAAFVIPTSVIPTADGYVMYYSAGDGSPDGIAIGRATSPDGITWTKDAGPVFTANPAGWDSGHVWRGRVLRTADGWEMFYTGAHGDVAEIGHATSPDGITWTHEAAPLITAATTTVKNATDLELGSVVRTADSTFLYYDYGPNAPYAIGVAFATIEDVAALSPAAIAEAMTVHEQMALLAVFGTMTGENVQFTEAEVIRVLEASEAAAEPDPLIAAGLGSLPAAGVVEPSAAEVVFNTVAAMDIHEQHAVRAIFGDSAVIEYPEQQAVAAYAGVIDVTLAEAVLAPAGPVSAPPAAVAAPAAIEAVTESLDIHEWHALRAILGDSLTYDDPEQQAVLPYVDAMQTGDLNAAPLGPSPGLYTVEVLVDTLSPHELLAMQAIYGDGFDHNDPEQQAVAPFIEEMRARAAVVVVPSVSELLDAMTPHQQLALQAIYGGGFDHADPEQQAVAPFIEEMRARAAVVVVPSVSEMLDAMTPHQQLALQAIYGDGFNHNDPEQQAVAPFIEEMRARAAVVVVPSVSEMLDAMTPHQQLALQAIYGDGFDHADPEQQAVAPFIEEMRARAAVVVVPSVSELLDAMTPHQQLALQAIYGDGFDHADPEQQAVAPFIEEMRARAAVVVVPSVSEMLDAMTPHQQLALQAIYGEGYNHNEPEQLAVLPFVAELGISPEAACQLTVAQLLSELSVHEKCALLAIYGEGYEHDSPEQCAVEMLVNALQAETR